MVRKTVYKGRKKKTIEYFAVKSVDKSQRSKVLNEVSQPLLSLLSDPLDPAAATLGDIFESKVVRRLHWFRSGYLVWRPVFTC